METNRPIFISYAHKGAGNNCLEECKDIAKFTGLDSLIWTDEKIDSGDNWQFEIEKALSASSVAILLLDWEFINSSYITNKEVISFYTSAFGINTDADSNDTDHPDLKLIPILIEPCPYEEKWPWLNKLQVEPQHSLGKSRKTKDRDDEKLTFIELDKVDRAKFKNRLAKRLGKIVKNSIQRSTLLDTCATRDDENNNPQENHINPSSRYLIRGEDLRNRYLGLQINLSHSEYNSYRIDVNYSYKEGDEYSSVNFSGSATIQPPSDDIDRDIQEPFTDGPLLTSELTNVSNSSEKKRVDQFLSEAFLKSREMNIPMHLHLGINANAGELYGISWEMLPVIDGELAAQSDQVYFSRVYYADGREAVECQSQTKRKLRVLSVYSDITNDVAYVGDANQQSQYLELMKDSLRSLSSENNDRHTLLRPTPEDLFNYLSCDSSFDVLYLVCQAYKKNGEYFLRMSGRDLSRTEFIHSFRSTPIPRLVILIPSCVINGITEDEESFQSVNHFSPTFAHMGSGFVITCSQQMQNDKWHMFIGRFVKELAEHGHVSGAIACSRHKVLSQEDSCKPVLISRLNSSRLWFVPGFVSEGGSNQNWVSILDSLEEKRLVPIIGPGVHYRLQQNRLEIARELADEYNFPLSFSHRINLPEVLQYVKTILPKKSLFLKKYKEKIQQKYAHYHNLIDPDMSLQQVAVNVALEIFKREQDNPFNLLARLPVDLYLTTNIDPLMETALSIVKDNSQSIKEINILDFALIDTTSPSNPDIARIPNTFEVDSPLIFKIFGSYNSLERASITEDDYFEFLTSYSQRIKEIQGPLEGKLNNSDFLFLGFKWNSLDFRVLYRAMQKYMNNLSIDSFHVAVQIDPDDDVTIHPDKALDYLRHYFCGAGGGPRPNSPTISVYWGAAEEFLSEFQKRIKSSNVVNFR